MMKESQAFITGPTLNTWDLIHLPDPKVAVCEASPGAPKTELNYDEHKRPSLTPSKGITVNHGHSRAIHCAKSLTLRVNVEV